MSTFELKLTISLTVIASGALITILLFETAPLTMRAGAALCLWGCALLHGMCWEALINIAYAAKEK